MADITTPLQEARVTIVSENDLLALLVTQRDTQNVALLSLPPLPAPITLLADASRTATTDSDDQTNVGYRGVLIFFNVSAVTALQNITPQIQLKDPISGLYVSVTIASTVITATNLYLLGCGAGIDNDQLAGLGVVFANSIPLGRTWRLRVVHSGGGGFSYSASAQYLP